MILVDVIQTLYDNLAPRYDKQFRDWQAITWEQAVILNNFLRLTVSIIALAYWFVTCGIAAQAIGLVGCCYYVTASDICSKEVIEDGRYFKENNIDIRFDIAKFRVHDQTFTEYLIV